MIGFLSKNGTCHDFWLEKAEQSKIQSIFQEERSKKSLTLRILGEKS
jgi:hypothetical protein